MRNNSNTIPADNCIILLFWRDFTMEKQRFLEKCRHGIPRFPIECFQTYSDSKHFVVPMHWHKNVEIMQIYKGSAELAIGTGTYSASAGDILIINQEELHRIESDDPTLHYGTFIFPLQSKKPAYF